MNTNEQNSGVNELSRDSMQAIRGGQVPPLPTRREIADFRLLGGVLHKVGVIPADGGDYPDGLTLEDAVY